MTAPEGVALDRDLVLPHLLLRRAKEQPDDICSQDVEDTADGITVTYSEFSELFLRWADAFRRHGVESGSVLEPPRPVLTMLATRTATFATWLGLTWIKALEAPINTMYQGAMLRYIINDTEAELFVIDARYLRALAAVADELPFLKTVVVVGTPRKMPDLPFDVLTEEQFLDGATSAADLAGPEYHDLGCMIYTSGTTGPSKGVLMPWAEVYEFPNSQPPRPVAARSGLYVMLPAFHAAGKVTFYQAVLQDLRAVCRESFSLTEFWSDVKRYDCRSTGVVGPLAAYLMQMPESPDEIDNPLEVLTMGPLIPEVEELKKRFGVKVTTGYGMTEIGAPLAADGYNLVDNRSCGRVREGYEVRIVNEHDEPVGPDVVGEMIIRSDKPWRLNAGYYKQPAKTAEAWRNGWFHTGDAFRYDADGNFYFVDRIKDAIRRRGENISSFEVEAYVTEHEAVLECAAIGVASEYGEDDVKICVFAEDITAEELFEYLAARMPRFMLPRYIEFLDDELPKTQTMRVQKVKLKADPVNENTWDREKADVSIPQQ